MIAMVRCGGFQKGGTPKFKTGHCGFQNRPLGMETSQYPIAQRNIQKAERTANTSVFFWVRWLNSGYTSRRLMFKAPRTIRKQ
jgi:hypothetical protein